MSCLMEHKSTYYHKTYIYCTSREDSRGKPPQHYYNFHLYQKMMMVMMMNMNTPMLNQTINIKITMKWDNQGEEQEGKNPDN